MLNVLTLSVNTSAHAPAARHLRHALCRARRAVGAGVARRHVDRFRDHARRWLDEAVVEFGA
jgi:hypothetical protein